MTGKPVADQPVHQRANGNRRYILTYGHRNVQGLAQRARRHAVVGRARSRHRDDEVNLLVAGGDYGWNPVPGYNECVPMTDQSLPGRQIGARWSSGDPTPGHVGRGLGPGASSGAASTARSRSPASRATG